MLAQFQSLYPNGNLISELVDIFQGKFIVRASVQIDGVTRATGLAAADTVEAAEDQARTRALMVLGVTNSPQTQAESSPQPTITVQPNPVIKTTGDVNESTYAIKKERDLELATSKADVSVPSTSSKNLEPDLFAIETLNTTNNIYTSSPNLNPSLPLTPEPAFTHATDDLDIAVPHQSETPAFSGMTASNVTPFTPRSSSSSETTATPTTSKRKKKAEPVDLSDVIAKTDVELQRLGWTPEQGREHLIKTYNKRGRTLLTEEELQSFLQFLQSQPDPIAGF